MSHPPVTPVISDAARMAQGRRLKLPKSLSWTRPLRVEYESMMRGSSSNATLSGKRSGPADPPASAVQRRESPVTADLAVSYPDSTFRIWEAGGCLVQNSGLTSGLSCRGPRRFLTMCALRIQPAQQPLTPLVRRPTELESVLGASPQGFESPILRHCLWTPQRSEPALAAASSIIPVRRGERP